MRQQQVTSMKLELVYYLIFKKRQVFRNYTQIWGITAKLTRKAEAGSRSCDFYKTRKFNAIFARTLHSADPVMGQTQA
jgi:hypothetical protein